MVPLRHTCLLSAITLSVALTPAAPGNGRELPTARQPAGMDRDGDALPAGALARLGTARLRHGHNVQAVAFSPDGKTLASAGWDHAVRLWDAATGKELRTLSEPAEGTNPYAVSRWLACVAFSPDGKFVAAGEYARNWPSHTIHVWEATTGKRLFRLEEHDTGVTAVAFAPDGKTLASAGIDQTVRLWDAATGRQIRVLQGHRAALHGVAFAPGGKTLASAGADGAVYLWDTATGQATRQLTGHQGGATAVVFSRDGRRLATAGRDGTVRLWDPATGKELDHVRAPEGGGHAVAFSPDGRSLAAGGWGSVVVWETATWGERCRFARIRGDVFGLAFAPDSRCLASAGGDTNVLVWDLTAGELTGGPRAPLGDADLQRLWASLAKDAGPASRAGWALAARPGQAVAYLRERLKPVASPDGQRLAGLMRDLGSDRFVVREKAMQELRQLGELAVPALRKGLEGQPTLEARRRLERLLEVVTSRSPSPETLRASRAIEVLERAGTADARQVLKALARGEPEARLTQEAAAALKRLAGRDAGTP